MRGIGSKLALALLLTGAAFGQVLAPSNGGTGIGNTATLTLGSANVNLAALGTGIMINTTSTGAFSVISAAGTKCYPFQGSGGTGCDTPSTSQVYPGAGIAVSTGSAWATSYTLGTGLVLSGSTITTVGQQPAQISSTFAGVPANSQILVLVPIDFAVAVPTGCTNSHLDGLVAATSSTTFTLFYLAGGIGGTPTSFGTAVVSSSGQSATFTCASGHSFSAGDYLEVKGPASADATFANIGFGLYGTR